MNITLVQRIKVFYFFFISTRLQWFCALERAKNPILQKENWTGKAGVFLWFVILPCKSSILRTPAMTVQPFITEITLSVCHMQQSTGSNRQEMMSPLATRG